MSNVVTYTESVKANAHAAKPGSICQSRITHAVYMRTDAGLVNLGNGDTSPSHDVIWENIKHLPEATVQIKALT